MAKGSTFERKICKDLSLWWTGGKDDDCFWRSSMSGGRATIRGRKGKRTRGHYGDIAATDRVGELLTSLIAFELKHGYSKDTVHDCLDRPDSLRQQTYEQWIVQARTAARNGRVPHWMIIHRRNRREIFCLFPQELMDKLMDVGCFIHDLAITSTNFTLTIDSRVYTVTGMKLSCFFHEVAPTDVKAIIRNTKRARDG